MKSMLIPIHPKWVAKILNEEKTLELRKTAPKEWVDYLSGKTKEKPKPIDVYIYCTNSNTHHLFWDWIDQPYVTKNWNILLMKGRQIRVKVNGYIYNGKVCAKFTLREVEEIKLPYTKFGCNEWVGCEAERTLQTQTMDEETLLEKSCLEEDEIYSYLNFKNSPVCVGYAYHISDLVIFNKPMEITEFKRWKEYPSCKKCPHAKDEHDIAVCENRCKELLTVKRAPQSWMYVEVPE